MLRLVTPLIVHPWRLVTKSPLLQLQVVVSRRMCLTYTTRPVNHSYARRMIPLMQRLLGEPATTHESTAVRFQSTSSTAGSKETESTATRSATTTSTDESSTIPASPSENSSTDANNSPTSSTVAAATAAIPPSPASTPEPPRRRSTRSTPPPPRPPPGYGAPPSNSSQFFRFGLPFLLFMVVGAWGFSLVLQARNESGASRLYGKSMADPDWKSRKKNREEAAAADATSTTDVPEMKRLSSKSKEQPRITTLEEEYEKMKSTFKDDYVIKPVPRPKVKEVAPVATIEKRD